VEFRLHVARRLAAVVNELLDESWIDVRVGHARIV
jgi:hypothetical protein